MKRKLIHLTSVYSLNDSLTHLLLTHWSVNIMPLYLIWSLHPELLLYILKYQCPMNGKVSEVRQVRGGGGRVKTYSATFQFHVFPGSHKLKLFYSSLAYRKWKMENGKWRIWARMFLHLQPLNFFPVLLNIIQLISYKRYLKCTLIQWRVSIYL